MDLLWLSGFGFGLVFSSADLFPWVIKPLLVLMVGDLVGSRSLFGQSSMLLRVFGSNGDEGPA